MREKADSSVAHELETLRDERDALVQNDVSAWLELVRTQSTSRRDYRNSLSWRITKPIRLAGLFSRKVRESGLRSALSLASASVTKRVRGQ